MQRCCSRKGLYQAETERRRRLSQAVSLNNMKSNKFFIIAVSINLVLGNLLFSRTFEDHKHIGFEVYSYFVHSVVAVCFLCLLFKIADRNNSRFISILNSFVFSYLIPVISINILLLTSSIIDNDFKNLAFVSASTFIVGLFFVWFLWVPFGAINAYLVTASIKSKSLS